MLVQILTPNGWIDAEQLELFRGGYCVEEVIKCCGTCRYWDISQSRAGARGICKLNNKTRRYGDMKDCVGWKKAKKGS